mmetsp:Transcript_19205/g.54750  ORF Transcript_19205/g.54750 Transcript_19205/m.54750 type:complete len:216 (-) Transcript_19205:242-889(-)
MLRLRHCEHDEERLGNLPLTGGVIDVTAFLHTEGHTVPHGQPRDAAVNPVHDGLLRPTADRRELPARDAPRGAASPLQHGPVVGRCNCDRAVELRDPADVLGLRKPLHADPHGKADDVLLSEGRDVLPLRRCPGNAVLVRESQLRFGLRHVDVAPKPRRGLCGGDEAEAAARVVGLHDPHVDFPGRLGGLLPRHLLNRRCRRNRWRGIRRRSRSR